MTIKKKSLKAARKAKRIVMHLAAPTGKGKGLAALKGLAAKKKAKAEEPEKKTAKKADPAADQAAEIEELKAKLAALSGEAKKAGKKGAKDALKKAEAKPPPPPKPAEEELVSNEKERKLLASYGIRVIAKVDDDPKEGDNEKWFMVVLDEEDLTLFYEDAEMALDIGRSLYRIIKSKAAKLAKRMAE